MIDLNDLLSKVGLDPSRVLVMRHRPSETDLRKILPWLALEHQDVYNAYQSQHGARTEAALKNASHLASFIGNEVAKARFVGVYSVEGFKEKSLREFLAIPQNLALRGYGANFPEDEVLNWPDGRKPLWFDLRLTEHLEALKGRLVIEWPGVERSWYRWADRNTFPILAIDQENTLVGEMQNWQSLVLTWKELQAIPTKWQNMLAQWRGIYLIYDTSDSKSYVGSASGTENILGRWRNYAATGDGGNKLLRNRDPHNFVFSILQRVSPDMDVGEVNGIEGTWKVRLHTRAPFGLNDN